MISQLHSGPSEHFAILRGALREAGYTEEAICRRHSLKTIFEFTLRELPAGYAVKDTLDALVHLLITGEPLAQEQTRALVPEAILSALEELGVIVRMGSAEDFFATVQLYPVLSMYLVSDRPNPIDPERAAAGADSVFTAISWNTALFLTCLPRSQCASVLDLCSGSGVAALACAPAAQHAWSCDLAQRSVDFAEFNCRLNGIENVSCVQGDLYEPVRDLTFDRIVAHPPYVPAAKQEVLYRDGGFDGEQVLRRIVEGVPRHLRPNGLFYAFTMATDRKGEPFEARVRSWLGEREREFDVLVVQADPGGKPDQKRLAQGLNITNVFFGAVLIAPVNKERPAVTARTQKAATAGTDALEWFMAWHRAAVAPGFDQWLHGLRPHMAPGFKLVVEHAVSGRTLEPTRFELRNDHPFSIAVACPGWAAMMISLFDGTRTAAEVFTELQSQRALAKEMTEAAFLSDLKQMLSRGFLELEEFPLPPKPKPSGG